jgi:MSHA pilin protein MshA
MSAFRQRGVRMIELVVIVVILGILGAVALPRYQDLENRARVESLSGMTANIRSAANMAHGLWLANGNTTPITVDGVAVNIVNGYPDANGIFNLIQDKTDFTVSVVGSTTRFTPSGARVGATCNVVYEQAANADSSFKLTVQSPTTLQSGC